MSGGAAGARPIAIAIVSPSYDPALRDPEALLARYHALPGWAEAVVGAGARAVHVVQRFARDVALRRGGVDYRFVAGRGRPAPAAWQVDARVVAAVRAARPDVVHVDGLVFPLYARALRLALPRAAAVVAQDHGGIHAGSPGFARRRWRALHRAGLRAADGFLFTAPELAAPWVDAGVIAPTQPIHAVPEASTDLADASARAVPALPGRPAVLWVGRLDENKDPLTALTGFERAAAALPDAALTMVFSDDALLAPVRDRVAAAPALAPRVHLRGRVDHGALAPLYAAADIFLLASHHEGSGFALLEALASGVTPVVTDIPSFRALTRGDDGARVGALFPPDDAAALAGALAAEAAARARDPPAHRARVRAHFTRALSWPAVGRRALAAYARAHAARRGVAGTDDDAG